MPDDLSTVLVPATPEYVLNVMRDRHRQRSRLQIRYTPRVELTFDTTIAAWRSACDLPMRRRLGHALNREWGLNCSDPEWRSVLEPDGERTLRDVCELMAPVVARPMVAPFAVLGRECQPAGAFLAIRSILIENGAPSNELAPSTPLDGYARRYLDTFLGPISRLAPGSLPAVSRYIPWDEPRHLAWLFGLPTATTAAIAIAMLGVLGWPSSPMLLSAMIGVFLGLWMILWLLARHVVPSRIGFGDLRTFRDLAETLTHGEPARRARGVTIVGVIRRLGEGLVTLLQIAFLPFRLAELGNSRHYRLVHDMTKARQPLSDEDYLVEVGAEATEAALWLEVRDVMAESSGLDPEAIRPGDSMDDLWFLQGADLLDLIFRLERWLGCKIPRSRWEEGCDYSSPPENFGEFAAGFVRLLRKAINDSDLGRPAKGGE